MAFNCRIFGHRGLEQILINKPRQFNSDSVFQLAQPYEFAETINVGGAAVSSAPVADQNSGAAVMVLYVEVPDGATIRYEINPPGRAVAAFSGSPSLSGKQYFYFRSGWTISLIDAAGLP